MIRLLKSIFIVLLTLLVTSCGKPKPIEDKAEVKALVEMNLTPQQSCEVFWQHNKAFG